MFTCRLGRDACCLFWICSTRWSKPCLYANTVRADHLFTSAHLNYFLAPLAHPDCLGDDCFKTRPACVRWSQLVSEPDLDNRGSIEITFKALSKGFRWIAVSFNINIYLILMIKIITPYFVTQQFIFCLMTLDMSCLAEWLLFFWKHDTLHNMVWTSLDSFFFFSRAKSITMAWAEWAEPTAGHYCLKCTVVQNSEFAPELIIKL